MSSGSGDYDIGTADRGGEPLSFSDAGEAEEFLRTHIGPDELRAAMAEDGAGPEMKNLDDHQILQAAAQRVARGEIHVYPRTAAPPAFAVEEEEKKAAPVLKGEKSWIAFRFVDDLTGEPIANLPIRITLPDDEERDAKTDEKGHVEWKDIPDGRCSVTCSIQGAKHRRTYTIVSEGDKSLDAPTPASSDPDPFWIAEVTMHERKAGESLDSIANLHGSSAQALAMFNWGTTDVAKVDAFLADGEQQPKPPPSDPETRMVRVAGADPARILIPVAWKREGLECGRTHTFRLEPISTARGHVSLVLYDDLWMAPLPGKPYALEGPNGERFEGTTDAAGYLEVGPVPLDFFTLTVSKVRLMKRDSESSGSVGEEESMEFPTDAPTVESSIPDETDEVPEDPDEEEPGDAPEEEEEPFPPEPPLPPAADSVTLSVPSVRRNVRAVHQRLPGVAPELPTRGMWLVDDVSLPSDEALA